MLDDIISQLDQFPLRASLPEKVALGSHAAVLVALTGDPENPEVILTERAGHLDRHAGEVAFPGGKWELDDKDLLQTALRETQEEIALAPELVRPVATLPDGSTKTRVMKITPFVGLVEELPPLQPELSEIASIFLAPLKHFTEINNYKYFDVDIGGKRFAFPYTNYGEYRIWGFTLRVLNQLLESTLNLDLPLQYPDVEEMYKYRELEEARQAQRRGRRS